MFFRVISIFTLVIFLNEGIMILFYINLECSSSYSAIYVFVYLFYRGESLDNLDSSRTSSWRHHSWLNQSASSSPLSSSQDFSRPVSTSNRAYMCTPSSSKVPPVTTSARAPSMSQAAPRAQSPLSASQPGSQTRSRWVMLFCWESVNVGLH